MNQERPRLTGFIRLHGQVSKKCGLADSVDGRERLRLRKELRRNGSSLEWQKIKDEVGQTKATEFRKLLQESIKEETSSKVIDEIAVLTIRFAEKIGGGNKSDSLTLSVKEQQELSEILLGSKLSLNGQKSLVKSARDFNVNKENEDEIAPFGQNIRWEETRPTNERTNDYLVQLRPDHFDLKAELTFDLSANQQLNQQRPVSGPRKDLSWLEERIRHYYSDPEDLPMSAPEFAQSLASTLGSDHSSEALQTQLFDLIGFERIELIEKLLEFRSELVNSFQESKSNLKREIAQSAFAARAADEKKPNYGCQVLVQSEEERLLKKQMRKEEKRMHKLLNKVEQDEEDEMAFDPRDLRLKRQTALATAMTQPILTDSKKTAATGSAALQEFPFVYDGLAKAKTAAGFIQGVKMSLPVGFVRKEEKKFEDITIPAQAKPASTEQITGKRLVPISSLDEVGKVAFQGVKTLNRIQSVVFESAYHTSENLLVCAPTGAGKTNVAMLTIVNTLRAHIENGQIKRDAFKIVYVAPMKALAAEMTANFGKRLAPLGIVVKELTGDMQLTKTEILNTQMLVTTPEKWDVVTRKPGDVSLAQLVRLLIIDEVHLLHGDRGPVVEALVARTLRLVESSQKIIRIVGLSATLPNYLDVANFLRVNPYVGLFFFDGRFRPVPLAQSFIGVREGRPAQQITDMNEICYDRVVDFLKKGHQVMVFVHARNATVKTGLLFKEFAQNKGHTQHFEPDNDRQLGQAKTSMGKSRNKQLAELFNFGIGFHHAGMLRSDRNLVEKLFSQGLIKALVCTATLAWGVNLPAHAVIIKGTEIYDAKHGAFVDVGILDVLQIFGRAGRPQFDVNGHGTIITSHDKLSHYLSLLTNQFPIESNFISLIADNLNAEISLGSVTNVEEGIKWLSYTYLFVRMRKNPLVYGIGYKELKEDPMLMQRRRSIIVDAAAKLDKARMIRFDERTEYLHATDLGRTASQFYIKYDTVEIFNELMRPVMNEAEILAMISQASEFEQLKVRDDEADELDELTMENCEVPVKGGAENVHGKVNILLQSHISRGRLNSFSLISDQNYVVQNASRISRALFEIVLRKNWPLLAGRILKCAKTVERQMWDFENPLKQHPHVKPEVLNKLENKNFTLHRLREMDSKEIGQMIHHAKAGSEVKKAAFEIPTVELEATIQPITRTVLRVRLKVTPNFRWNDRIHGGTSEPFWIWVEDPENNHIYHHEYFLLSKKGVRFNEPQEVVFTIPIFEPLPTQYYVRAISDRWIGSETYCAISFKHLILPEQHPPHTNLLDLQPLPVAALHEPKFQSLYKFDHFNPIQTQIFHTLYHTDHNVLLGAPTGSGKTIAAEIAMFKVFRESADAKVVYIAPLKALVRERMDDWKVRFGQTLGKKVVELTGDVSPDVKAIKESSLIVTTPEKWDGISRSWQTRDYVKSVALIVIDEIHLLGEDRGPVLEVIVSRTNFIASHTSRKLRVVGLSTALANARDLADWLGIDQVGLFNFRPSVRPVPLEVHISGYPGKHYCPRMATMNKPTFQAIRTHSPEKPALVFVSSRRQTRLTAFDLFAFLAGEENPKMWLHMDETELQSIVEHVKDQNLKLSLAFGIGMHHAGLVERDRKIVEELFVNQRIQVLIATATVAWGVNFPAHLVVIKGTEYYDGKEKRYVDMPITDVLQMMGRAGRPQYDDQGVACVLVHDAKKHFYKKFLYEPFPVESSLHKVLPDHLNAEVVAGTIANKQDAVDYITWTYLFRRLLRNPSYYGLEGMKEQDLNEFLTTTVEDALFTLEDSFCVNFDDDGINFEPTTLGRISSYYYLSHWTVKHFHDDLNAALEFKELLKALSDCKEYEELPVRHNEEFLNEDLSKYCPMDVNQYTMDSPHTKANLLLQSHFCRNALPSSDYYTDTKSVLDQSIRILQAMIDVCADNGWLATTLQCLGLLQMIVQGRWFSDSSLMTLPHVEKFMLKEAFHRNDVFTLAHFIHYKGGYEKVARPLRSELEEGQIEEIFEAGKRYPAVKVDLVMKTLGGRSTRIKQTKDVKQREWIKVTADTEYTLMIHMKRMNPYLKGKEGKAFAPKFPKAKDEGWFLVMGCVEDKDLLALKRAGSLGSKSRSQQHQLTFFTPETPCRVIYQTYIMSDCYLGLDQQYELCLEVVEAADDDEYELDDDEARFELLKRESEKLALLRGKRVNDEAAGGARPKQFR